MTPSRFVPVLFNRLSGRWNPSGGFTSWPFVTSIVLLVSVGVLVRRLSERYDDVVRGELLLFGLSGPPWASTENEGAEVR